MEGLCSSDPRRLVCPLISSLPRSCSRPADLGAHRAGPLDSRTQGDPCPAGPGPEELRPGRADGALRRREPGGGRGPASPRVPPPSSLLLHWGEQSAQCRPLGSCGGAHGGDLQDQFQSLRPEREGDWQTGGSGGGVLRGVDCLPNLGTSEELLAHQPEPALDTVPQFPRASSAALGTQRGLFLTFIWGQTGSCPFGGTEGTGVPAHPGALPACGVQPFSRHPAAPGAGRVPPAPRARRPCGSVPATASPSRWGKVPLKSSAPHHCLPTRPAPPPNPLRAPGGVAEPEPTQGSRLHLSVRQRVTRSVCAPGTLARPLLPWPSGNPTLKPPAVPQEPPSGPGTGPSRRPGPPQGPSPRSAAGSRASLPRGAVTPGRGGTGLGLTADTLPGAGGR